MRYRLSFSLVLALLLSFVSFAEAKRIENNIQIASGVTVHGNAGVSIYVVDMRGANIDPFQHTWDTAGASPFSLQFSEVTCAWVQPNCTTPVVRSGATISIDVAESNYLPSGASRNTWIAGDAFESSLFRWTSAVSDLAHDSGNTKYVYPYAMRQCRYQFIKVTTGVTSQAFSLYLELP